MNTATVIHYLQSQNTSELNFVTFPMWQKIMLIFTTKRFSFETHFKKESSSNHLRIQTLS